MRRNGFILPGVLGFMLAAIILSGAVLTVIFTNFFVVGNNVNSQQAFNIAEAGINYYLWHMAHNGTDFKDGQSTPTTPDPKLGYGPYVHNYVDSNAKNVGTYTLWIKPQGNGSTIATVRSIGKSKTSDITRTIDAKIGAASFASYGLLSNTEFWFGENESANGPVFSNVGVHMDGPNTDTVQSANSSYVPQSKYGGNGSTARSGVWCSSGVSTCAGRDKSSWLYPKPAIDFNQVSTSLCTMKKTALANDPATASIASGASPCSQTPTKRTAAYLPRRGDTLDFGTGYLIKLNTNGTYDLYNVDNEDDTQTPYTNALTLSTAVATNVALPSSGVIFAEDNVWVLSNPTFHGRVTIGAGRLAANNQLADINIAGPLVYSTKNGQDAIGLVAENNIYLAPYAPPASGDFGLEVDAATLAGSGSVTYRQTYKANSDRCSRGWTGANQTLNYYGSIASRLDWTWNFASGAATITSPTRVCGSSDKVKDTASNVWYSGIERTNTSYDYNLLYAPPPSYPITGGYNILSWREVLTRP